MSEVRESAHWFGAEGELFGIVSLPPAGTPTRGPGVVLMSPGTLHRVGGARLNVRLARHLARRGFPALRFDLSGLGDSELRQDGIAYVPSMVADVRSATSELLRVAGSEHVALLGHCTGAAISYETALVEERVAGVVQLEGFAHPTRFVPVARWRRILTRRSNWARLLGGKLNVRALARRTLRYMRPTADGGAAARARNAQSVEEARQRIRGLADLLPPRERMREELGRLVGRNVRMLNIYAGGDHHYYQYRRQFADAFPGLDFRGLLELEHVPDANHYFSSFRHQAWLDARILSWMETLERERLQRQNPGGYEAAARARTASSP